MLSPPRPSRQDLRPADTPRIQFWRPNIATPPAHVPQAPSESSLGAEFIDQALEATTILFVGRDLERRAKLRWFAELRGAKIQVYADIDDVLSAEPPPHTGTIVLLPGSLPPDATKCLLALHQRLPRSPLIIVQGTQRLRLQPSVQRSTDMRLPIHSTDSEVISALLSMHRRARRIELDPPGHAWLLDVAARELATSDGDQVQLTANQTKLLAMVCEYPAGAWISTQDLVSRLGLRTPGALHTCVHRLNRVVERGCGIALPLCAQRDKGYAFFGDIGHACQASPPGAADTCAE